MTSQSRMDKPKSKSRSRKLFIAAASVLAVLTGGLAVSVLYEIKVLGSVGRALVLLDPWAKSAPPGSVVVLGADTIGVVTKVADLPAKGALSRLVIVQATREPLARVAKVPAGAIASIDTGLSSHERLIVNLGTHPEEGQPIGRLVLDNDESVPLYAAPAGRLPARGE